jgi:hypothetical protein
MARSGFISPNVYLQRAFGKNISLDAAKQAAVEALQMGRLSCRGRFSAMPVIRIKGVPLPKKTGSRALQDIPQAAFEGLTLEEIAAWNWETGTLVLSGDLDSDVWRDVRFNEAQANEVLTRLEARSRPAPDQPEELNERRRGPTWDEWVAVVATLAFEHAIDEKSTDADILQRAAIRLGIPEARTSRMKAAALAIVRRWKQTPPMQPPPLKIGFSDPSRKP